MVKGGASSEQLGIMKQKRVGTPRRIPPPFMFELRRIPIPRTWLNRSKKEGRRLLCSEGQHVHPKRCVTQAKAPPERGLRGEQEKLPSCTDCWAHSCRRGCPRSGCQSQTCPRRCPACYGQSGWR